MMEKLTKIIREYADGTLTLEEANAALKEAGASFTLDPGRNKLQSGEEKTHGLLDTGTGYLDKVEIRDMRLVNANVGNMYALCLYQGRWYQVDGDRLVEK